MTVKFMSVLKDFLPEADSVVKAEYTPGLTVQAVLDLYNLPSGLVGLILVNGKAVNGAYRLSDQSTVELYPIFGGG